MEKKLVLHGLYQSGMVLQRSCDNCISGKAGPGEKLTVSFKGDKFETMSGDDGSWELLFNPGEASGPDVLVVESSSGDAVTLTDVYTGELWLCSGQSNMQLQMNRLRYAYPEEFALSENPCIRMFTVPVRFSFEPLEDLEGGSWLPASPSTLEGMSGSSYFMAKKLHSLTGVPVGIINASQGGSPITSWMSEDCFPADSVYARQLDECRNPSLVRARKEEVSEKIRAWHQDVDERDEGLRDGWCSYEGFSSDAGWQSFNIPGSLGKCGDAGIYWFNREICLTEEESALLNEKKTWLWLGRITDSDTAFINGKEVGGIGYMYPPRRYEVPSGLLHPGRNIISIRVCIGGLSGPLLFEKEKPYMLFTDNVLDKAWRKSLYDAVCSSAAERQKASSCGYVCIDLSGEWRYRCGCIAEVSPSELFYEWKPTALYNGMLYPLRRTSFRGAVWYQGEANAAEPENYEKLLISMVELWRKCFSHSPVTAAGNCLPFVIAELPLCSLRCAAPDYAASEEACRKWLNVAPGYEFTGMEDCWVSFRKMQAKMAGIIPDAALASFYGAGEWNDLHPEDKKAAGNAMAEAAFGFIN